MNSWLTMRYRPLCRWRWYVAKYKPPAVSISARTTAPAPSGALLKANIRALVLMNDSSVKATW